MGTRGEGGAEPQRLQARATLGGPLSYRSTPYFSCYQVIVFSCLYEIDYKIGFEQLIKHKERWKVNFQSGKSDFKGGKSNKWFTYI
jgi:hypothetical protein